MHSELLHNDLFSDLLSESVKCHFTEMTCIRGVHTYIMTCSAHWWQQLVYVLDCLPECVCHERPSYFIGE